MPDKTTNAEEIVAELADGMTIGIGGWGSRRKPMAVVRAMLRSPLKDLTLVAWGGPDVGMLCAAGKVRKVVFAFATLDSIPLEPHFRNARQNGTIEAMELDEGMFYQGLYAAGLRLPFLPTRAGLGSDLMKVNPGLKTIRSPYEDGEELVAMPALQLDAAVIHMNRGDRRGNGQFLGPDPYFDELFLMAARKRFMTVERIVPTEELLDGACVHTLRVNRMLVDGVAETPHGAHFTSCVPDYARDEALQSTYAASATSPEAWADFRAKYLDLSEADYQRAVGLEVAAR